MLVEFAPCPAVLPSLAGEIVHVWRVALPTHEPPDRAANRAILSPDECARADRYRFAPDAAGFVATRSALRRLLGAYRSQPPYTLRFATSPSGKPFLPDENGPHALRFSVSHTTGVALVALTRNGEIGVDVERVRPLPDMEPLAQICLSPAEYTQWQNAPPDARSTLFFACWTGKEAYLKARGTGLTDALPCLTVREHDVREEAAPSLSASGQHNAPIANAPPANWLVRLNVGAEWAAALVGLLEPTSVCGWHYDPDLSWL